MKIRNHQPAVPCFVRRSLLAGALGFALAAVLMLATIYGHVVVFGYGEMESIDIPLLTKTDVNSAELKVRASRLVTKGSSLIMAGDLLNFVPCVLYSGLVTSFLYALYLSRETN